MLAQLRRGVLQYCVLALVADERRYGLDLVRELTDAGLVASEGSVYPLLARLRREGLVETSWQESVSGPPRRYYRATTAGQGAVADFRTAWSTFAGSVDKVMGLGGGH